jgi:hypothetical protein
MDLDEGGPPTLEKGRVGGVCRFLARSFLNIGPMWTDSASVTTKVGAVEIEEIVG